jgi:hypothetical protein
MKVFTAALAAYVTLFCPLLAAESETARPWLRGVADPSGLEAIQTVQSVADVEVSDGDRFSTTVVYHDPQRAIFQTRKDDRTFTMGIEGRYVWSFDGKAESEVDAMAGDMVLGHQFHAQILFFDRFYPDHQEPQPATFGEQTCHVVTSGEGSSLRSLFYDPAGRPLGMVLHHGQDTVVTVRFGGWKKVGDVTLPFDVEIDDGRALFEYHYTDVRLNEGSLEEFRAPLDRLTDEQALLRLHRVFMDGHLFGRSDGMREGLSDNVVIVTRGEVHPSTGEETLQTLQGIIARADYTTYDDLIRPIVRVSDDGTLGWVIVQIAAAGVRLDQQETPAGPFEFVSAWVELYEKVDGRWRMSGNVSNFRS